MESKTNGYTFGDSGLASARLRLLAALYSDETRALVRRRSVAKPMLAVDLGSGPGWSTRLLHDVTGATRTIGLDASQRYVDEGRSRQGPLLEFYRHDITRPDFPVDAPDLLLCRYLLTHLAQPEGTTNG